MEIKHVMIFVDDMKAAKKFYAGTLGIPVKQDLSKAQGMLIMDAGQTIFTIHTGFKPSKDSPKHARICVTFGVDDIEQFRARLKQHRVELLGEIQESPVHKYMMLKDPAGNIIEIGQYN